MLYINKFTVCFTLLSVLPLTALPASAQRTSAKPAVKKTPNIKRQPVILDREKMMSRVIEERFLAQWKPTKENASLSDKTLLSPQVDIVGTWHGDRGHGSSTFIIQRAQAETYTVTFKTYGCLGRWSLKRTGRFDKGVLLLDRPVQEYCDWTYRKLYTVHVGKKDYLVSDAVITAFQNSVSADRKSVKFLAERFYTFTKEKVRPSQRTPSITPQLRKGGAVALAE